MPIPAFSHATADHLGTLLTRALNRVGAVPQFVKLEPVTGLGLLVSARIRDQVVQAIIPPGECLVDDVAASLVGQLHTDNGGLPPFAS